MVVPKFRAWVEAEETMHPVLSLDWSGIDDDLTAFVPMGRSSSRAVSIDNAILMQSTGLFDKNGKEIFEGDIVVNKYGNVGYVAYLQQEAGFVVVLKKSDYRLGHRNTGESYDVTTNHEIIGNIYQNPELVEE